MKTGKITAKLRDAVPVCLMVNGEEVKRYKNIELPDMLKEVEMTDFHFNVHMDGKITFEIHFEEGVLPEIFPEPRTRKTRAAKAKAAAHVSTEIDEPEKSETAVTKEPPAGKPAVMELHYNVTGIPRKALVVAISDFVGAEPEYKAAPSFAYAIGDYIVDKEGTLIGPTDPTLVAALAEQGYTAAE